MIKVRRFLREIVALAFLGHDMQDDRTFHRADRVQMRPQVRQMMPVNRTVIPESHGLEKDRL